MTLWPSRPDDRARVAADLIASLEENRDDPATVQTAWAQEIERRARRALTEPQGEDWDDARARIAERLSRE